MEIKGTIIERAMKHSCEGKENEKVRQCPKNKKLRGPGPQDIVHFNGGKPELKVASLVTTLMMDLTPTKGYTP